MPTCWGNTKIVGICAFSTTVSPHPLRRHGMYKAQMAATWLNCDKPFLKPFCTKCHLSGFV